jgi:hypothetical protein
MMVSRSMTLSTRPVTVPPAPKTAVWVSKRISSVAARAVIVGVRVDDDLLAILKRLADEDDRTLAAMTRKLVMDALRQRGELK